MRRLLTLTIGVLVTATFSASGAGLFDPIPLTVPHPEASPGYVHLSSRPSEASAEAALTDVARQWGAQFEGLRPLIRRVDMGANGVRFRVLLKTHTVGDAARICLKIKSAGGDCFVAPLP